jgi:hypothetical protein
MHPWYDGTHPDRNREPAAGSLRWNVGGDDQDVGADARGRPGRQPRYPVGWQAHGPEALRPHLATGLPICDGWQLIGIRE